MLQGLSSSLHPPAPAPPLCASPLAQDPSLCSQAGLTPSASFQGAASRACTAAEAQPYLPTISRLIVGTPQVGVPYGGTSAAPVC